MPKKNKKSKFKKCDQNSSRKDESSSLTPDETVAKEGFCLPLDKKLKMQIKRHKKKGEIQITDTSNAETAPEVENVEKNEVVSVSIAANNDATSTALEPKVTVSSPEVNETEETRGNGKVEEPVDDVTKNEGREQVETSEPKASEANYRIEIIPEDLFEEFIEKEEVTQVRETVKAFPRISPIHSPNAKRKHLEKEALVTSCPPPKVLYNYQGISFNDTYIQAHLNEDDRFQDERKEQDNSHNWKLHVIQEESSDLSDTSAHSEPKEKSRIRTVIIDNRGIPEEVEFQSTGLRSEGREPCKLYSLEEEMSEDLESNFSSINNSSAACEIKSHFLNECDDSKTDFGEKGSVIGSDQSEALTRSVEGSQSGLDHSNENIQNGENKKPIKMRTDLSEKSTWSIKSISSTSYQPDEESESWRSSLEPEIYNGSEADIESELDSLAVCILDNYDDKLGISMNDIVPVDYSDGIKLFITNYKYKNILNKPENVDDSTADLQTSASPVEVPCKATFTQQVVSDISRTNESVIGNDCATSCNKNGVPVIADGDIKKQTITCNGDVKNKIEALKDDVEKILISKIKVMKSFNDPTLNETSWGSIVESTKNEMKLRNARTNDWNCSSEKWHTSNASSYENVSRLETMVPVARYVFQTKETQNPDALSNLAEKKILTLPYGKLVLKKIGLGKCCSNDSDSSKDFAEDMYMKSTTHENEQSFGLSSEFSDVSTQSVPLSIWNRIRASEGRELSESRSYIEFDYADRRIGQTEKWYGAPTVVPAILLGLSPSQKKVYEENPNRFMADKAEAASLLDLHKKFLERRSYNESNPNGTHKGHEFDTRTRRDFVTLSKIDGPDRISGKMTQSQPENKNLYTLDKVKESSIAKKNMKSTNTVGHEPESPKRRLVGNEKSKPVDSSSGSLRYNKTYETEAAHSTSFEKGKGEKHGESEETVGKSCLLAILQNAISDNSVPELNKDCSTKPNSESHEVSCVHNHGTMLNSWQNNPIFGYTNQSEESLGDELFGEDHTQSFEKIWNKEKNITTGETKKDGKSRPRTICCGTESELLVSEPLIEKKYAHHKTFPSERSNADTNEKYIITEKLATVSDTIRSFEQTTIQSGTRSCRSLPNVSRPQIQNSGGYQISRQGDVVFHQKTGSDEGRKVRNENRKSMPAFLLSEREKFKQKMYDEYMSKLAERVERRQKKVIRVSQSNEFEFPDETKILDIENEFIKKVKERREKFGRPQTDIDEELESLKKTCQEFTDYWKEETTNLESGKIVFGETKNKNEKDGETETSSSKRSSFQLISDRSSDFDSLPKHLKELLEVDKEEFPDFLGGVWSPNQKVSVESTEAKEENQERKKLEDEPIPPVWTPRSAQASPVPEKKEFRPVNFESPVLSRKKYTQEVKRESSVPPPWQQPGGDKLPELAKSPSSPALSLPRAPNPTVTLLQKAREGYLPRGARYLNSKVNDTRSPDDTVIERLEFVSSTSSKTESERPRDGEVTPKKVVGIGPTSKEGIPLVLRSEVNAENKEKWYKRMYDSLHKAGSDDDYVTVKYRTSPNRRGVYGYQHGSTSGYQSEPETLNSDLTSKNYITLDRRREETVAPEPIIIKTRVSPPRREYFPGYKNQPGKIEDYEPGRSSISEVEANKWWDEVLEIFDREEEKSRPTRTIQPSRSFTNYASGYISDPQFVYKRTEDDVQSPPSSEEQKEAYKIIQKGGEIPLKGLRKPAPERPKDDIDTEIEYFPLSSTLTRIRVHKQNITPLCDFPFSLNPSVHQETTLSFPDLSYGVCSSYAQIQLFSPCGQHELNQDLGEFSNSPVVEIHPRERDKKFSVHLQNISEPNNYVPVVPKPRIKQRKPPIYVNLPVSGKSDSSDLSIPKEEESQIGIFQVPSGLSRNVSSQSSLKKQGFATFSELKRIAPSLLTKRTRSVAPPKTVIKIAKAENTSRKSSIPVSLSSLRDKKSILSGKSKETLISRREIGLEKPKEKRETSQSRIADQEPKRLKKETKKCKLTHSESFQRVKPPSKTNRSLKTLTINVNRNKAVIKSLSKEKKNKEEENRDKENKRKRTDSDSKAGNSDIPALQSSASNLKSSPSGSKKAQSNAPTEATGSKMSSAYDNSEQASMPRIDDNVTEAYRNRSFSPDVRRKIFKLPDMNKPLPPKRKQSKYSPTLRILSKMKVIYPRHRSRLDEYESNVKFLQDKIKRKLKDEKETKIEFGDVETVRTVKKDKSGEMSIKTNRFVRVSRPLSSESLRATYPDIGHRGHIAESRTRYGSLDGIKTLVSGKSIVGSDVKNTSEIVVRRSVSPLHKRKTIEIKESSRKGTIAALPPKKSSSPNPSLSSLRSGISMKSPVSDKGSTSSTERIRSPHTKLISPNSSVSRLSSVSRSISPVTPVIKTRSQKTVDSRLSAKKSTIVPIQQKSVIAKRAVKQREVAPVVKKCAGQRILLSKIEKTAIAKAESAKKVTQVGKTVVSGKEKLRRDKIGTVLTVIKKDPVEETGQEKNEITAGRDLVRTDSFFQNLFLRNATERRPVVELNKLSSVLELAQMYQRRVNWPETYKSEPSLVTFYLNQKRPVSLSKFRRFDSDFSSSRSHSPLGSLHSENFQLKLRRFDSMSQFGDGLYKDHSPEGKERSSSEPPFFRSGSNSPEEEKCTKTSQSEANSMRSSPNSSRSPSSRRIRSYRSPSKPLEYYRCIKRISSRARSAGDVEKIKSKSNISGELAESTSSLNLSNFSDHAEYSILEFIPTRKCERFRELHKFYSNLERMEKLEKTASTGDLRPRLRNEEIIDFDRWKKVRTKERAEAELKTLVDNLMKTQKEKDLLFRAADVAAIRWKGDRGLRIKERSVEDLKEQFNRYTEKEEEPELMVDSKRTEKYLWKGGSVVDVTGSSTLSSHRYKPLSVGESQRSGKATSKMENECGYTLKAWSSLSNEELRLLKGQLSEIYTQEAHRKRFSDWSESVRDKYDIIVPSNADIKSPGESSLRVQCASTTSRSQTLTPTKERKEILRTEWEHSGSVKTLPLSHEQTGDMELSKFSRSHSETRHSRQEYFPTKRSKSASSKPLSEDEKKRLSLTLSREVIEKMAKGSSTTPVLPRETMGALAVASGKFQKGTTSHPKPVDDFLFVMTSENRNDEFIQDWRGNVDDEISKSTKLNVISELESGSGSSETSIKTVIRNNSLDVLKKVQYFEDLQQGNDETAEGMENVEEFNSLETREYERKKVVDTVDRHTENFRKDKSDVMIEVKKEKSKAALTQSSSLENIDHYFGQQKQYATSPQPNKSAEKFVSTESSRTLIPPPVKTEENIFDDGKWVPVRYDSTSPVAFKRIPSRSGSYESLFSYRSRSVSPDPTKYYRTYLRMVKCGAVRKLCNKFESWEDLLSLSCDKDFWLPPAPRRFASDPELTRDLLKRFGTDPTKVTIRGQEVGDVRWLRTKFEKDLNPVRGRSRFRRVRSPLVRSSLTGPDRFMPRINVISKKAELQLQGLQPEQGKSLTSPTRRQELPASPEGYTSLIDYTKDHGGYYFTGEVEKLKRKFEKLEDAERLSILGQMYTSTPDVNELRDIAPYLECGWVAHRHPGHSTSPEFQAKKREPSRKVNVKPRPRSSSPVRTNKPLSILKQSYPSSDRSVFADQKFDPSIHRPKYRYQPERDVDRRFKSGDSDWWRNWNKPTVTFKEAFDFGFDPDISQICDLSPPDSPRKYVESEVTIHYKSPVRSEAKAMLSEDELARRQAESMKRIYKEERRRKYLQELQDMNSRRHTDNFTPSQKSPIPLNRYDDFPLDCNQYYPKTKDHSIDPVLVARGLYDFVGKRPRDLAFRRGDIIFIMRRLDKNWCEGELNGAVGLFPLSYVEVIPYNEIHMKFGRARAKYDFAPQTPLELSARKGDMVTLIRKIDENWFEGRIGERTGIIPASYCHIMAMPQASRTVSHTEKVSKPVAAPAAHSLIHDGSRVSSKHYYTPYLSSPNSPGRSTASATSTNYSDGHLMTADMLIDEALMQLDEEFDLKRGNSNVPSRNVRVHPRPEPALYQVLFNHVPNNDDELELVQGETVTVVEKCGDGWYIGSKTNDGKLGIFPGTHVRRIAPEFV